jgi:DNA-binding MarR family transcriptional regulator
MAANVLTHHCQNPFKTEKQQRQLVLFTANEYETFQLVTLTPILLRVLLCLANRLNESGYACATLDELARSLRKSPSYVNQAIVDLVRLQYITKKKRGEYWVNPEVFRTAVVEW